MPPVFFFFFTSLNKKSIYKLQILYKNIIKENVKKKNALIKRIKLGDEMTCGNRRYWGRWRVVGRTRFVRGGDASWVLGHFHSLTLFFTLYLRTVAARDCY